MRSKGDGFLYYAHRQSVAESLAGLSDSPCPCAGCVNHCHYLSMLLCASFGGRDYKPVKIRKTTMRKLLKRRRAGK